MTREKRVYAKCDEPGCIAEWQVARLSKNAEGDWCKDHRLHKNCVECGRAIRPFNTRLDDYPGTVVQSAAGICDFCYKNPGSDVKPRAKSEVKENCIKCGAKMRPRSNSKAADWPGAVARLNATTCRKCFDHARRFGSGKSFTENQLFDKLERLPVPAVTDTERRNVRRLIEDRFEGDDYLLSVLGLVGEDTL